MQSPQALRNGGAEVPSPSRPRTHQAPFLSTPSVQKLRRFNIFILLLRFGAFCFSFAAATFMLTNSRGSDSPRWSDFDAFRFVLAANAIVAAYSLLEMGASVWEISRSTTLFPEFVHVWFDFGHDQVFTYLLLSAGSAGTELARTLKESGTCRDSDALCVQSDISIGLGFAGFLFLGACSLVSGFRLVCFIISGSRFQG